jgi:GNAT superfamily N-acetyltransferase
MEIRALVPGDLRQGFDSGNRDIDEFFQRYAGQNQWRHHVGVTYCLLEEARIVGFVTLAAGDMDPQGLSELGDRSFPRYPAPVLRLTRLGVSHELQGTGLGRQLLAVAVTIALEMRVRVGCVGVVVDAKPDAVRFYERRGFRVLPITSRMAGAGAPPVRLFTDLRHLLHGAAAARDGLTAADSLATEMHRRARELGLSADEVRTAVDRMLG